MDLSSYEYWKRQEETIWFFKELSEIRQSLIEELIAISDFNNNSKMMSLICKIQTVDQISDIKPTPYDGEENEI